jgi:bacillithiol synthase
MTDSAGCRLPLASYAGMNTFVLGWLAGSASTTRFLARRAWIDVASRERKPRSVPVELVEALVESNLRWGSFVREEVEKWASGEAVAIVAGQQVGFAGGPLYTLAKLASMIRMKRELAARGIAATVFFWLATEDHDFDEAATLRLPASSIDVERGGVNRQLDLVTLKATRGAASRRVVGPSIVPESLVTQFLALYDMPRPSWLREGITFCDSFAELLATVAGERIVFVDSLLPELRRAGAPLFERMLSHFDAMQSSITSRSRELSDAGFTPQILPRDGDQFTLLFRVDDQGERHIIDGAAGADDPATISTSAITRPLLQDAVIQPDIFVGGPSEVAYYAQIAPLHDLLGVTMPAVALRGHALVAPKRVVRLFSRFGIDPAEVFSNPDKILAKREPAGVAEVHALADAARRDLAEQITKIGEIALPAEHALARAINRSIGHIEYHFDKLAERAVRGLVRKDRERYAAVRELVSTFYPDGHVQDRVVAWFAYWHRFGQHLVDCLAGEIEPDSNVVKIISL